MDDVHIPEVPATDPRIPMLLSFDKPIDSNVDWDNRNASDDDWTCDLHFCFVHNFDIEI